MADKPILFSAPMVRALLAGTKTQTRREFKGVEEVRPGYFHVFGSGGGIFCDGETEVKHWAPSHLRIAKGDRLYVREHWRTISQYDGIAPRDMEPLTKLVEFVADGAGTSHGKHRQAMHMPRWASRLTLTVTDVRVERLQDCTEADALAEGMTQATAEAIMGPEELATYAATHIVCPEARGRILYETIWDHINGPGSWKDNPWVAAYTFTVHHGNIDQMGGE